MINRNPKPPQYTTAGTAIWHGTGRVIAEADTDTMARMVADAINYAVAHGWKWEHAKEGIK